MNQVKYSAYALLLVFTIASVAIVVEKFSTISVPAPKESSKAETTSGVKAIKNIEGKNLFQSNCQSCHAIQKDLTGPALANIENRAPWTDRQNLIRWVKNSMSMVNEFGYTKQLFEQYNRLPMPSFNHLSDKEIESILDYVKEVQ